MESRVDLGGGGDQHRPLRPDRTVRRRGHGPLRAAAGGPGGARAADGVGRADDAHAARVAVAAAVGRARRIGDRRHLDGARSGYRDAMVRRTPRPGARCPVGRQCHGAIGLPSGTRETDRTARLEERRAHRRRRCRGGLRDRGRVHARSAGRSRTDALRIDTFRRDSSAAIGAGGGAAIREPLPGVLATGRNLLHLWRQHQRADWNAPDCGVPRLRYRGSAGRRPARRDGHLRHHRHDGVRLADGSLLEPVFAVRLLHAPRRISPFPAAHARQRSARAGMVRRVLRPRLGRGCRRQCA